PRPVGRGRDRHGVLERLDEPVRGLAVDAELSQAPRPPLGADRGGDPQTPGPTRGLLGQRAVLAHAPVVLPQVVGDEDWLVGEPPIPASSSAIRRRRAAPRVGDGRPRHSEHRRPIASAKPARSEPALPARTNTWTGSPEPVESTVTSTGPSGVSTSRVAPGRT